MARVTPLPFAALAALLAAEPAPDAAAPPPAPPARTTAPPPVLPARTTGRRPVPVPRSSLPVETGAVTSVDHAGHRIAIAAEAGPLALDFDRNTVFRAPGGAATPLALRAGDRVRIGRDGDRRAAWVELLAPPPSTPAGAP
jgi:hypothetical protein